MELTKEKAEKVLELHISKNPNESTFMNESNLPSLPLPTLQETLERYLEWCEPLLTVEEFHQTKEIARNFMENEGPVLQQKLLQRAKTHRNWMESWWLHYAYLIHRPPLIPYLNTSGPETLNLSSWPPSHQNAMKYAGLFIYTNLLYFTALREERVRPQASVKGQKFSMDQFRRLYCTTRIPGKNADSVKSYWKSKGEGDCPMHMVVICNGHLWRMEPFDGSGNVLELPELESQLLYIRKISDALGEGQSVGTLTCDDREMWAKNRAHLSSLCEGNAETLLVIDSAVMVLVLDNSEPQDMSQVCLQALCGDISNRWADKSVSAIIFKNGYVANNNDHTPYDAMVMVFVTDFQRRTLETLDVDSMRRKPVRNNLTVPQRMEFALDDHLTKSISSIRLKSKEVHETLSVSLKIFDGFGKDWMKSAKCHPDAFVQMSLQLAYYRTYKTFAPTYETATTRQFYHGRTETMRSCTNKSKAFVLSMENGSSSVQEKAANLRSACQEHDRLMRVCQSGKGVDRHLLGLYLTAVENGEPVPDLFTDQAFTKTGGGGNFILSTSTVGYTGSMGGVAPMVQNGYGTFYSMLPTKIFFYVSSFKDGGTLDAPQFAEVISSTLNDMKRVMDEDKSTFSRL